MIDALLSLLSNGLQYIRSHPQLFLTLVLIIVIPYAFLISGQQFLKVSKENQERLEKDRIGLMHDVFASYLIAVEFEPEVIQKEIDVLSHLNPDITKFRVVKDTTDGILAIAAQEEAVIGNLDENASAYRIAQVHEGESVITPYAKDDVRYWQSFRLVKGDDNEEYYIFTETSLEKLDVLLASRIRTAYYWLFGLLALVLILVLRHVKLIDYSYLYKETKRANEMKDLFTNMVTHELRTPLTAIRGYASLIRENDSLPEHVQEQSRRIEESSARLVLIVNDLLDVARIQAGKLSVDKHHVDLSQVIESVLAELEVKAEEKNINLKSEGVYAEVSVTGDSKRLHQALTNLVSNAIKYTPKGSITVELKEKHDRVELRVKDTGMGIEAKDQKELFAPFFRVKGSETEHITGTGLGMWITKELIELMGGSIGVESIRGVGTHVVVTFPK